MNGGRVMRVRNSFSLVAGLALAVTPFLATSAGAAGVAGSAQSDARASCPDRSTRAEWRSWCLRDPVDGDDGGVSGIARREWSGSPADRFAQIRFEALGEKITISNYTTADANFQVWKDGDLVFYENLGPQDGVVPFDRSWSEGDSVTIFVRVLGGRGAAEQTNLRS